MSSYEKWALRPLGLGSTKSRAPCTVAFWKPGVIAGPPGARGFFGPGAAGSRTRQSARYIVTPTNATICGR
jgi:hypothetical protein